MTDPQPMKKGSTSAWTRLRAAWRLMLEALRQAIPADEPWCEHGYAAGYCPGELCPHSDQEAHDG